MLVQLYNPAIVILYFITIFIFRIFLIFLYNQLSNFYSILVSTKIIATDNAYLLSNAQNNLSKGNSVKTFSALKMKHFR